MDKTIHHTLVTAIARMLRPLVRNLLRHGVSVDEFMEISRRVYVEQAESNFTLPGRKQTDSRIAVLTGLNRKEVARLRHLPSIDEQAPEGHNRAARVVNGWLRDVDFHNEHSEPAVLRLEGEKSFTELVKRYAGDVPVRAVLDELRRTGAVKAHDDEGVMLVSEGYVPHESEQNKIEIFGNAAADLIGTLDHNLTHRNDESRLQLTLAYNNLPEESLEGFKELSKEEVYKMLHFLNNHLAAEDRDVEPLKKGTGRYRAGIGVYYFEEPYQEKGDDGQ